MITDLVLANQLLSMATVFRISETVSVEYRDWADGWLIYDYCEKPFRYQCFGQGDQYHGIKLLEVAVERAEQLCKVLQSDPKNFAGLSGLPLNHSESRSSISGQK